MRLFAAISVIGVVLFSSVSSAYADDLFPPPWRGGPRTTMQEWAFSTNQALGLPPDVVINPYGQPYADVYPGTGQNWWPVWGGHDGVWPLSGTMEFFIPNASPNDYKDVWIQITWAKQSLLSAPILSSNPSGAIDLIQQIDLGPTGEPLPAGPNWWHTVYNIRIYPNPTFEVIRIDGTIMVDQVVIDTICVPEPAALGTLALGALALIRRRR